jgi:hypothetical protein
VEFILDSYKVDLKSVPKLLRPPPINPPNADIKYLSEAFSQAPKSRDSSPLSQRTALKTLLDTSANNSSETSSTASPAACAPITGKPFFPSNAASA